MSVTKSLFSFLFLFFYLWTFSQQPEATEPVNDSLSLTRQRPYEAELKQRDEIKNRMKRDMNGFMDSLNRIKREKQRVAALDRIKGYESNPQISELKEIDISGAQIAQIPEFVYKATNVEILVLDNNSIPELPEKLQGLKKLRRIYWRNNGLGNGRVKIAKLEEVEKLDVSENGLKKLPNIHRIKGIEELVLESNDFEKIPIWRLRKLKNLRELEISQNPLELDRRWYWLVNHVKILKLNKCNLVNIHPSFYKLRSLEELQIQVNKLRSIPDGISNLSKLSKLSFYKNELDSLPKDIFKLHNLEIIDLYYNRLRVIPEEIGNLTKLKILYLSFNEIYDIPEEIGNLSSLEELYIHHNRLSEVAQGICRLEKLKILHFQNNYVPQFPRHILSMNSIQNLDISGNDITSLPEELEDMSLKSFFWENLDIDFNHPENYSIRDMILRMSANGVNIIPRVYIDQTE